MSVPPKLMVHIQPWETFFGGKVIRHYGLLASATRKENLARARELLAVEPKAEPTRMAEAVEPETYHNRPPCLCCGGRMNIIETFA